MGEVLKGKSAVVTGAGRGIGRAIALALAAEGANVVVNDIGAPLDGTEVSTSLADETVGEIRSKGGQAVANYDSVAEYESAGRIIKTCVDSFDRIDILVNNAGNFLHKRCFDMTPEDWDVVIKTHLYGNFFCSRHACVYMREQKQGRIIGLTSDAYLGGLPVSYSAAKGGIVSFIRTMAMDLLRDGITCNCIAPGAATRMSATALDQSGKAMQETGVFTEEQYEHMQAVEWPPPEAIAPIVVYLASDYGSNINGAVLGATGGKISIHSLPTEVSSVHKDFVKEGPWTMEEMRRVIPVAIEPYCVKVGMPVPSK